MAYATVADLAARWRPLSTEEQTRASALLDDASVWLDTLRPAVAAQAVPGGPLEAAARILVVTAVRRAMLAPDGVRQTSTGTGPYSDSVTYANPAGNVYFTDAELVLVDGYVPEGKSVRYVN